MNLQDQVISLEQAKRLKELGVVQESLFCFIGDDDPDPRYNMPHKLYLTTEAYSEVGAGWYDSRIAAFTVAELGVMLPGTQNVISQPVHIDDLSRGFLCARLITKGTGFDLIGPFLDGLTEAEARAAMLIHLLENNLITVEEVNNRLTNGGAK